jgi:hypothetical protein
LVVNGQGGIRGENRPRRQANRKDRNNFIHKFQSIRRGLPKNAPHPKATRESREIPLAYPSCVL